MLYTDALAINHYFIAQPSAATIQGWQPIKGNVYYTEWFAG